MTAPVQSLTRALMFAAQKHTDQRRKGARAEPYVNHLIDVVDTSTARRWRRSILRRGIQPVL